MGCDKNLILKTLAWQAILGSAKSSSIRKKVFPWLWTIWKNRKVKGTEMNMVKKWEDLEVI